MAIYSAGPAAGAISGNLGGALTFVNSPGSKTLRRTARKTINTSPQALNRKAAYAHFAIGWRTLTDSQRQSYTTAAQALTFPNRLGQLRNLSPFQFYMRLNLLRWPGTTSLTGITTTPLALPIPTDVNHTFTQGGPFTITWTDPGGEVNSLRFTAARNVSDFASYNHFWRRLPGGIIASAETFNIYPDFSSVLGDPGTDEIISVLVHSFASGFFLSPPVLITGTVT